MNESEYYEAVLPKIANSFENRNWVLGSGKEELIEQGMNPKSKLFVTVEPISQMRKQAVDWNLQLFIPIFGYLGSDVLFAKDAEIFLSDPYNLYYNVGSQSHYFKKHIFPVIEYETNFLKSHGVAHMVDMTPSGWHMLFKIKKDSENENSAYNLFKSIGYLEPDLINAYGYTDPNDLKRNPAPGAEAGYVFSGIGRIKEYIALKTMMYAVQYGGMPIRISDTREKCVNQDITDTGDPGYMRIMRGPFTLHKKRRRYFPGCGSLQDVILAYYSGLGESDQDVSVYDFDLEDLLECMWNKEKAVAHSENFSGHIPYIDDEAAASLIGEYKSSQLFKFHDKFDKMYDLRPNMALYRTYDNARLSGKTHDFVKKPCPRALQPPKIKKFVRNLLESEWHPKHIGCLIDDLYRGNFDWNINWMKYPSKTRANFWARIYSAVFYLEEGLMEL